MNIEKFWEIVDLCKDCEHPDEALEECLCELHPEEIADFAHILWWLESYAFSQTMWCAAYLLNYGCSDDGFTDFRRGLVSKGRTIYEIALKNPDDLICLWGKGDIGNESFGYAAHDAYARCTGLSEEAASEYLFEQYVSREKFDLYIDGKLFDRNPQTEWWNFDDEQENHKRLPRLTEMNRDCFEKRFPQWLIEGQRAA
ncbi:hypothetical protein P3T24_001771 [Paraburkholderia sp. GAS33]|uniref:DUF4240 domain-containing protein n=1 Tax=Paraburkholderia sp. GAS33 TaxID=3035130 RepID=UPI003D1E5A0E